MKIKVSEEGVQALKGLAAKIVECSEEIKQAANALHSAADSSGLGPHQESINSVIQDVMQANVSAADPVADIAEKLNQRAEKYQAVIDHNRFQSRGN